MSLRMVEIVLGEDVAVNLKEPIEDVVVQGIWRVRLDTDAQLVRILVESDQAEKLLDICRTRYGKLPEFRCFVLEVGATLPRLEAEEEKKAHPSQGRGKDKKTLKAQRISREELYDDLEESAQTTLNYLALAAFSTIVAAIGLMRDNVAVIIGAMVIAPLLGPNMALSLAVLLGDSHLARRAVKTILVGLALALGLSFLLGSLVDVNREAAELASRGQVEIGDVALALCAGAAGALSFTGGLSSALVGVMVAVALLPPLAACGLSSALGDWRTAGGAGLLFLINLVCINLASVIVFRIQGIRPEDKARARHVDIRTIWVIALWTVLLGLLIRVIIGLNGFE